MSRLGGLGVAFEMGLREYARTPVLVALLVFLPAYFVGIVIYLLPASPVPIAVPGSGTVAVTSVELYGVLLVPLSCGLIGGLAGVFLMMAARDADARLVVVGFRPAGLVVARFGLLAVAGVVTAGVSLGVLSVEFVPETPGWYVVASLFAALTYGAVGMLAGLALSRLAGVYFVLFVPMVDVFFFQNPMVDDPHWIASYLPGRYVTEAAVDAGFSASVALGPFGRAAAYLAIVATAAAVAHRRAMRVD